MTYSKKRAAYTKEIGYLLCIVIILVILVVSIFGPRGYKDLRRAKLDLQQQRARVEQLERENRNLKASIEAFLSNKTVQEEYLRQKGYGREGEKIQRLDAQPSSSK
jgi:cell division protein FtsB